MGYAIYYDLVAKGKLKEKDREPNISGLEYYTSAFSELSTSRASSMGVGQIPFTAIVEYFKIYPSGEFDEFLYVIRRMDKTFIDFESSKTKKDGVKK